MATKWLQFQGRTKPRPSPDGAFMVEPRGVEPLSEGNATQASTGVATDLMSPEQRPVTGSALGQPDCLLLQDPRRRPCSVSHLGWAPILAHGRC